MDQTARGGHRREPVPGTSAGNVGELAARTGELGSGMEGMELNPCLTWCENGQVPLDLIPNHER